MNEPVDRIQKFSAPPTVPRDSQETELLLAFLHERDTDCPRCGYNLRNLTQPVCPECREQLVLKVGVSKLKLHWLFATLAPGMFSGIAAAIFVLICLLEGPPPRRMWQPWAAFAFLSISGIAGVLLAAQSKRFLHQSIGAQVIWALIIWGVHVGFLMLLLTS